MVAIEQWMEDGSLLLQHGLPAVLAVVGVALWFLGRSLARPLGAVAGLLAGAAAAMLLATDRFGPIAIIVASSVGCLVSWLLFRLWIGVLTAMLAATLVAGGFLLWPGTAGSTLENSEPLIEELADHTRPTATDIADALTATVRDRWDHTDSSHRTTALVAMAGGALIGLLGGLAAPYWAASVACAGLGTVMASTSIVAWGRMAQWPWPQILAPPLHTAASLGLITLLGVMLQWIIFRSRSD